MLWFCFQAGPLNSKGVEGTAARIAFPGELDRRGWAAYSEFLPTRNRFLVLFLEGTIGATQEGCYWNRVFYTMMLHLPRVSCPWFENLPRPHRSHRRRRFRPSRSIREGSSGCRVRGHPRSARLGWVSRVRGHPRSDRPDGVSEWKADPGSVRWNRLSLSLNHPIAKFELPNRGEISVHSRKKSMSPSSPDKGLAIINCRAELMARKGGNCIFNLCNSCTLVKLDNMKRQHSTEKLMDTRAGYVWATQAPILTRRVSAA